MSPSSKSYVARAELTLALDDSFPLRDVPMKPDPLSAFARAFGQLQDRLGETAEVNLALQPVTSGQRRRRRRKVMADERRRGLGGGQSTWGDVRSVLTGDAQRSPGRGPANRGLPAGSLMLLDERAEQRQRLSKLASPEPLFALQVMIRTTSEIRGRPEAHLHALIACFEQFAGENYFRVVGRNLGFVYLGADAPWRRGEFDRRLRLRLFSPAKQACVTATEVAGLLKPPTAHCRAANVVRSGGVIPPPPHNLPTYSGQRDLLPLGVVQGADGERVVGVPLEDTLFTAHFGRAGYGKALALDTPLPTPSGWTTMGDAKVGDLLFDERGVPARVIGATEVMVDHECFEVVFSDGSTIVADADHRWMTWSEAARKSADGAARRRWRTAEGSGYDQAHKRVGPQVLTTREIAASLRGRGERAEHSIPTCGALQCPEAALVVEPYALGVWLGDGASAHGGITSADEAVLAGVAAAGYPVTKWADQGGTRPYGWGTRGLEPGLRRLGVLGAKHIPPEYLRASARQRHALLCGLMDTDGSAAMASGQYELSFVNRRLAEGAYELVVSLGIKAVMSEGRAVLEGRDCGPRYRICFTPAIPVFRLARKRAQQRLERPWPNRRRRYVVDVRPVPSVPVRCIAVDSPSHLYLAGRSFIPTHNTEEAVVQFVALVRSGRGGMYLDPHGDALERILPCLGDMAERVLEINLARGPEQVQAGWNVLSMQGLGPADVETKVGALTSAFASALSWTDQNTRALSLTTMAAQSLCELALQLPPDLAPTIFQMVTILANDDWRGAVLPYLSRTSRDYWTTRFAKLAAESITPVTNLLDRLRASSTIAALFGSSRSTYDIRQAMDTGKIVLACPAGIGDKDKLIFSLFLFDLFRAAKSRQDTDPERRRPFHTFLDELQVADSGQSSETVARMLREGRKYGLRVHAATQQPTSLSKTTLTAMLTNRSHLFSTVVGAESAAVLAKEWAGLVRPETITRLEKYHFLASVTLGGEVMPPFLVRGLSVDQAWGHVWDPTAVPEMHEVIDRNLRRRPVAETLAALDTLDDRIIEHLERNARPPRAPEPEDQAEAGRGPARRDHVRHLRRH